MVRNMPETMIAHADEILGCKGYELAGVNLKLPNSVDYRSAIDDYAAAMKALAEHARGHESIDTYAKKLFLTDKNEQLDELKILLTTYFSYAQRKPTKLDTRYDGFFASILSRNQRNQAQISNDVIILTWNYDLQLAFAFRAYWYDFRLEMAMKALGLTTLDSLAEYRSDPKVVYLNGIAAWSRRNDLLPLIPEECSAAEGVMRLLNLYVLNKGQDPIDDRLTMLRFAWENNRQVQNGLDQLVDHLSECEVLVAIGYSFPFFNRDIDRAVIGRLPKLKKVYLQSTANGIKSVANAFKAIPLQNEVTIELYDAVDKFMLPPEL